MNNIDNNLQLYFSKQTFLAFVSVAYISRASPSYHSGLENSLLWRVVCRYTGLAVFISSVLNVASYWSSFRCLRPQADYDDYCGDDSCCYVHGLIYVTLHLQTRSRAIIGQQCHRMVYVTYWHLVWHDSGRLFWLLNDRYSKNTNYRLFTKKR